MTMSNVLMVEEVSPLLLADAVAVRKAPACGKSHVEEVPGFDPLFPMQYSVNETAAVVAASFFQHH